MPRESKVITFSMPPELAGQVQQVLKEEGRTMSEFLVMRGMRESASRGFWVFSYAPYGYNRVMVQDGPKKHPSLKPDPDASLIPRGPWREVAGWRARETPVRMRGPREQPLVIVTPGRGF